MKVRKVRRKDSSSAWNFNFNNGNENWNNRNNSNNKRGFAVRSRRRLAFLFTYNNIYRAYLDCRKRKRNKQSALAFEFNAEQNLLELTRELVQKTYRPFPSFCFIAQNDKHREVFAADFRDRVVHHFLVRRLEKIWEPIFIHDSFACRKGKGTHAAVKRLQSFARKVTTNQTRHAWFCQLDIRAFFPSIDRQILLDQHLQRLKNKDLRWLSEIIIMHDPSKDPVFNCSKDKWLRVPAQKSLFSVPEGKGLPIGNLTSQFFANVYLNVLDQYVKHKLKARYYVRYVDDLVLLHEDRQRLEQWKMNIAEFLKNSLKLELNPNRQIVRPISNGINFLGYIIRPSHLYVRRRTINRCKLSVWNQTKQMQQIKCNKHSIEFCPENYEKLYRTLSSYFGAFSHASCHKLIQSLLNKFTVLNALFVNCGHKVIKRWKINYRPANLYAQYHFFRAKFRGVIIFQVGCFFELYNQDALWAGRNIGMKRIRPRKGFYARCGFHIDVLERFMCRTSKIPVLYVFQSDYVHGGLAERIGTRIDFPKLYDADIFQYDN